MIRRELGRVLVGLAAGFAFGAGSSGGQEGTPARSLPWTHAVLVSADGSVRPWGAGTEALPASGDFAVDHLWAWSENLAVVRLSEAELGRARPDERLARLKVRLRAGEKGSAEAARGLMVLAGPVEMWQEVPEDLLPRWPVAESGEALVVRRPAESYRVRAFGETSASDWREVGGGDAVVTLRLRPATKVAIHVRDERGASLSGTGASLALPSSSSRAQAPLARWRSDDRGSLRGPPLPTGATFRVTLFHPLALPYRWEAPPPKWPREVRLSLGCRVSGRIVGADRHPLGGARISGEAWLDADSEIVVHRDATSNEQGEFEIGPFPLRQGRFEVAAAGHATLRRELALDGCQGELAVGDVRMRAAATLSVRVEGEVTRRPIEGASIVVDGRSAGETDRRGTLEVGGLAAGAPVELEVTAPRFLPFRSVRPLPAEGPLVVRLEASARLVGRVVADDGSPIRRGGAVLVERGRASSQEEIGGDGNFEVELAPRERARLGIFVEGYRDAFVDAEAGEPGESRSLGDIVLSNGLLVRGRLLDRASQEPIVAGVAWVPRAHPGGPLVAKTLGMVRRAITGQDGDFTLSGLPQAPAEVRLEAPGFALRSVLVLPEADADEVDLGDVELSRGAFVTVRFEDPTSAGVLSAEPAARGALERLTVAFTEGSARIGPLPGGRTRLWAEVERRIVCERTIDLDDESGELEVECEDRPIRVSGEAWSGSVPTDGGTLLWLPRDPGGVGALVLRRRSPMGAERTDTFGGGRPQVDVPLTTAGYFVTDELAPGEWQVLWSARSGSFSRSVEVRLTDEPEQFVRLEFPGSTLEGRVVFADGRAAPSARVSVAGRPEWALAASDGTFRIVGLGVGDYLLRARLDGRETPGVAVRVQADELPAPVELVFDDAERREVVVSLRSDRVPVGGALLLIELAGSGTRLSTADSEGLARVRLPEPAPSSMRVAAVAGGTWAFGDWRSLDGGESTYSIVVGDSGNLLIESVRSSVLGLSSDTGWDVAAVLRTFGVALRVGPEAPLVVSGLPVGTYVVTDGAASERVEVVAGTVTPVTFDAAQP